MRLRHFAVTFGLLIAVAQVRCNCTSVPPVNPDGGAGGGGDAGGTGGGDVDGGGGGTAGAGGAGGGTAGAGGAGGMGGGGVATCTGCDAGCCSANGTCVTAPTLANCGANGAACVACGNDSNSCNAQGQCVCGTRPRCAAGLRCSTNDTCVCDALSGCQGCCVETPPPPAGAGIQCLPGTAPAACGTTGRDCQACAGGDTCDGGVCSSCTPSNCANGCCNGSQCLQRSLSACGTAGSACVRCDPDLADSCNAQGQCACGSGPACPTGSDCRFGQCVCNAGNCAGCCVGNVCVTASQMSSMQCGRFGNPCANCGSSGQCDAGVCSTCNSQNCPQGCCQNGTCQTTRTVMACGPNGSTCVACDPTRADRCSAFNSCVCGNTAVQCPVGLRCSMGQCVCDSSSCRGCCGFGLGGQRQCFNGTSDQACGQDAGTCRICIGAAQCIDGGCQ